MNDYPTYPTPQVEQPTPSRVLDYLGRHPRITAMLSGLGVLALTACGPSNDGQPESGPETSTSTPSELTANPEESRYAEHTVTATVFAIGEEASADNAYIPNTETAWDSNATDTLGGFDDPEKRDANGLPTGFTPRHNVFYFALPAEEFDENGLIPGAREASPWTDESVGEDDSLFKGRWIEVKRGNKIVYAQWVDCGPSDDPDAARDYDYVFGSSDATPANDFGLKAGLDLSPAAAFQLGFGVEEGGAVVTWKFVDSKDVPEGLWTQYDAIDNKTHYE